jgi:carbon-monoxide dehydrogenase large subunit
MAKASGGSGIGARVKRKEDERHLHGRGRFVSDILLPNLHEVAFLRSPLAHARVRGIEIPEDIRDRVFTADSLEGVSPIRAVAALPGFKASDYPPLATGKVRFVGETVAMCLARTRADAEDIAERVRLDLEELPAVVDEFAALEDGSALVHEEWGDNLFLDSMVGGDLGDLEKSAPVVVEREYRMARQVMNPMEGKAVLAYWDDTESQLVVYTSTQVPHMIRTGLSQCLGLDESKVRVIAPDVGGGFGYKCVLQPEEICVAWLAMKRRHPVRWVEDRREHLVAGANSREHHYKIKAFADEKGKLLGLDAVVTINTGAYSVWPFTAVLEAGQAGGNLPGPYVFDKYRCAIRSVATNKPPFTPYRGVARPGVCFAMDLTIDAVARAVGREPHEVRKENLVQPEQMPFTNITNKFYDSGDFPASVVEAVEKIDLAGIRKRQEAGELDGRLVGVGFATYVEQTAHGRPVFGAWGIAVVPGYENASVKLTADGGLEIRVGVQSHGQGMETTLAQIANSELGIDIDRINVFHGDTGATPFSTGTYASRGIVMAGGAVATCCRDLVPRMQRIAAHFLQCKAEEVRIEDGMLKGPSGEASFADIGRAWYLHPETLPEDVDENGLEVVRGYKPGIETGVFGYATHAALVAVDPELGSVEILDYVIAEDCGTLINPMVVEGQSYGGAAQGIGTALYEEVPYSPQGQPLASTLADYVLPGPTEVPRLRIYHTETPSPFTAHGQKGIGEGGAIAPHAAIGNAINDALRPLGAEVGETPMTPHRILDAIAAARAKAAAQ